MNAKIRLLAFLVTCILPNTIKIFVYRNLWGARIDSGVRIGFGALLIFQTLELRNDVKISPLCIIRTKHLSIGARTKIGIFSRITLYRMNLGPSVTIGPQVSILASDKDPRCEFSAGAESWIFEYCYINPARPIRLGRNVGVGGGTYIFGHGLWLSKLKGYPVGFGEVNIGNDVWLPWGCFIMPGVSIGDGAVIGARSVITKNVPAGSLFAGSPAKMIKDSVATEPPISKKIEILEEVTRELCDLEGYKIEIKSSSDWIEYWINDVFEIGIAKEVETTRTETLGPKVLSIVHHKISNYEQAASSLPMYSLQSFQCSPRHTFSHMQTVWLNNLRKTGTRHYPMDETQVE